MMEYETVQGDRRNQKRLRSYSIRKELDSLMRMKCIDRSRKAENAVTLFIKYCVNYTDLTSLSENNSTILKDYLQHQISLSGKSREYNSFKGLKDDVMLLERLLLSEMNYFQKVDFSLMNTNLWTSEETISQYKSRNFFLQ